MTDDPADVGRRPPHVALARVEVVSHQQVHADGEPAVHVHDAFGLSRGARRVEHERGITGVHRLGLALGRLLRDERVEIDLTCVGALADPLAAPDHDVLDLRAVLDRSVDDRLEIDDLAAPIGRIRADEDLGAGVVDAVSQRLGAHAGVHHRVDCADPGAGVHGEEPLRRERHIKDDPVPPLHPEGSQGVGDPPDLGEHLAVGEGSRGFALGFGMEGNLVAEPARDVPLEAVVRKVELAADEPVVARQFDVGDLAPLLEPLELARRRRPKRVGIRRPARVPRVVVLHRRRTAHARARLDANVVLCQRFDRLFVIRHRPRTYRHRARTAKRGQAPFLFREKGSVPFFQRGTTARAMRWWSASMSCCTRAAERPAVRMRDSRRRASRAMRLSSAASFDFWSAAAAL